jgi:hypothetical protein
MTFTQNQMEVLAQYEGALRRAHFSRYCNALQKAAYNTLANIYDEATGTKVPRNPNCQSCLFFLLDRLGAAYFTQKTMKALDEVVESDAAELEPLIDLQGESKPQAKTNYKGKRGARGVRVGKVKA